MKHLLKVQLLSKLTTTLIVCLWSVSAWSGTAIGIHDFGPDITENQSCEIAKLKATKQLIEDEIGQVIQVNDIKSCVNDNCELNTFKWITFPGVVTKSVYDTEIINENGYRYCMAKVDGFVMPIDKIYDEDHDFSVVISKQGMFYNNDSMKLDITAESHQYFNIFAVNSVATKIYPNDYDPQTKADHLIVPNDSYTLKLNKEENPNELLVVISSKKPFEMNSQYAIKDFGEKVLSMKSKKYRIRIYDFVVQ